jgi:hypothetical protein
MNDVFRAAQLARKKRIKWWREHSLLAHAVVIGTLLVAYIGFALVIRGVPKPSFFALFSDGPWGKWLAALGVTPSGINLLLGTAWCGLGVWGIRTQRAYGLGLILMYALCLLSGMLTLAKAFAFI